MKLFNKSKFKVNDIIKRNEYYRDDLLRRLHEKDGDYKVISVLPDGSVLATNVTIEVMRHEVPVYRISADKLKGYVLSKDYSIDKAKVIEDGEV